MSTTAAKKATIPAAQAHPTYMEMIKTAIKEMKERTEVLNDFKASAKARALNNFKGHAKDNLLADLKAEVLLVSE